MSENGQIYRIDGGFYRVKGVRPGTHLSDSRDTPGAKRGLLRDDVTNKVVGHAELEPVEEWELAGYGLHADEPDSDSTEDSSLGAAVAGLALVGLTLGVIATAGAFGDRKSRRRDEEWRRAEARRDAVAARTARVVAPAGWYDAGDGRLRWWDGEAWTEHFHTVNPRVGAPPDWYDDGAGRERWWDGQTWTEHFRERRHLVARNPHTALDEPSTPSHDVQVASSTPSSVMSSAEWQERVRAMILARAFSEEQWRLLSHARIDDGDDALLAWQSELRKLTPQEFSDRIEYVISVRSDVGGSALHATAGWYDDGSGRRRWWDGRRWTEHRS